MRQKSGFVLVSVLIITTITTMLALSQIGANNLQERIAGNQQKEFNARLAAEEGIIFAFEYISSENADGSSNSDILSNMSSSSFTAGKNFSFEDLALSSDNFTLVSKGSFQGAFSYLKTSIIATEQDSSSLFTDAVVGCEGVAIGNGKVDSYNSTDGAYDASNANYNGSLATIKSGSDIVFSGSGSVYGNVISNGSISTGTGSGSTIVGDLTAANNISLKGIDTAADIHAGGDFSYKNLTATGQAITVGGDIDGSGSNTITSSVSYGGVDGTSNFGDPTTGIVPPDIDLGDCDPLDIPTVVSDLNNAVSAVPASATDFSATMGAGQTINFNESSAASLDSANTTLATVAPVTISLPEGSVSSGTSDTFNETSSVYIFNSADFTGQDINISGDIIIVVQGDIMTKNTTFTFVDDSSSLTILTAGQIDLNSNTTTVYTGGSQVTVNDDDEVPVTIYSSYESAASADPDDDLALTVTSNADIYAKVYAPLGNVSLTGGGNIMGAVRGGNVTFNSSAGQIHYDEALMDIDDTSNEEVIPASYSSVYYYYP